MSALNLRIEKDMAIIEFDQPDSKVNVLNKDTMRELDAAIDAVLGKSEIKALLIVSKKEGIFIAGADIKEVEDITSAGDAKEKAEKGKAILDKINNSGLVTVAVINGVCLGGGLELALACKYRVAGFSDKVKLGLPEVKLGIIPGFGGTQRLPRITGLTRGLNMILSGEMISGKDALKCGLVDRLFPEVRLVEDSIEFTRGILQKTVHTGRRENKKLFFVLLEDTPFGRAILFYQARKNVLKKTKGFYPAPLKAIEVIRRTYGKDFKAGSRIESEAFGELAVTDVSKNLIKVFYLNEEFKKLPWVAADIKPDKIDKCGIIGAGVMGGGIAQLVSFYDIPSRLKDINYEALKSALRTAKGLFDYAVKKKILRQHQADHKMGLISPTTTYRGFENTGIVIEAVVEDLNIKQKIFKELSQVVSPTTVLASNTSSLPIIDVAQAADHPERAVGLHFFNPVHRMPLVEVIRSEKSGDRALATTIAFARRIGKVVIVVKDVPGFLINRILLSYMNEAGFLFEEGMDIRCIDRIARDFGMPMGPIELVDEVGIDVGYKVAKMLESSYGPRMRVAPVLEKVKEKGLFGKKSKAGFYLHKGNKKEPNPVIYGLVGSSRPGRISDETALKRMIYIMVNEAARCLEEKVADRPQTVDIGMIMGTGFPPFRAGLLRYADSVGIGNIIKDLENFEKGLGEQRFKPCNYLIDIRDKRGGFYGTV
ncbi:MAG: 3-hydroxyacyl-CoA dehydrogenase NAD-binding domain-containing protein [Candidatus Omnitrophota bacterium]|nr:3-hydroxyacyl-CoA dehydrogenase NAD-binding domain-containing protein [Candidatus Omnitrophota bacterium]